MLPRHGHTSHADARLCRVQPGHELRRVAGVGPHHRAVVAHVGGGQGEERLARLVRRDGRNVPSGEVRLGRLRFTALVVGAAVGAAVAAVCAGPNVAGVGVERAVRVGLVYISVSFGMMVTIIIITAAARAGGTRVPLVRSLSDGTPGVWRLLSTGGLALFLRLLLLLVLMLLLLLLLLLQLSVARRGAAGGSRAGRNSVGRIGLLAAARISIGGDVVAGHPEPDFIAAAAAGDSVPATVPAAFIVGLEAGLVLQRRAVLPELQAGDGRPAAGLLVRPAAGGAQLGGGRGVWFTDLRTGLSQ